MVIQNGNSTQAKSWNPSVKKLDKRLSRTRRLIMKFNYVRERTEDTRLDYGAISNSSPSTSVLQRLTVLRGITATISVFPVPVFSGSRRTAARLHSIRHRCCNARSVIVSGPIRFFRSKTNALHELFSAETISVFSVFSSYIFVPRRRLLPTFRARGTQVRNS